MRVLWVAEGDARVFDAGARLAINHTHTFRLHVGNGAFNIIDFEGDVLDAGAALVEIACDGAVRVDGFEQLELDVREGVEQGAHALVFDDFLVAEVEAQDVAIQVFGGGDVGHGDAEVVDALDVHVGPAGAWLLELAAAPVGSSGAAHSVVAMVDAVALIQATLAPIFLVSGAGIFVTFAQSRLFRVVDRLRETIARRVADDPPALDMRFVRRDMRRAVILRNAVFLGVLVIMFTVIATLLLLSGGAQAGSRWAVATVVSLALALTSFAVALVLVTVDAFLSVGIAVRVAGGDVAILGED